MARDVAAGQTEFSVCQFFEDGSYEYVRRWITAKEAMEAFGHYTRNLASKMGIVVRVIVTDGGDCVNAEWKFGEGYTYPPELVELAKQKGAGHGPESNRP